MSIVIAAMSDSSASRRAVERTADLFPVSQILVATVVPADTSARHGGAFERSPVRCALDEIAVSMAHELVGAACERIGQMARPIVLRGEPASTLIEFAGAARPETIVVGSLGSDSVRSILGDSVGFELLRRAPCTVIELGRC